MISWRLLNTLTIALLGANLVFARDVSSSSAPLLQLLDEAESVILLDPWRAYAELEAIEERLVDSTESLKLLYYQRKARALQFLYIDNEFEEAIEAASGLLTESTPVRARIMVMALEGVMQQRRGNYSEAIVLQEKAVALAESRNERYLQVFSTVELAFTRALRGSYEAAQRDLQSAYTRAMHANEPFLLALVDEVYGVLYAYTHDYERSVEHYRNALDVYKRLGYEAYTAEAYYGLGITYRDWARFDQAIAAFEQYREIIADREVGHGEFTASYALGTTYAQMGNCERALPAISTGLEAHGPEDYKSELYKRQAVCLAEAGQAEAAHEALANAKLIFDAIPEIQGTTWEIDLTRARALVEWRLGNTDEAMPLIMDFHDRAIDLERRNASERMLRSRTEMENERKDLEIELLREQANVTALRLETQQRRNQLQRYNNFFWVVLFAVALIFLLLQRRHSKRLEDLSTRDSLTGLYNRRHIFGTLEELTQKLPRDRGKLSVVLVDVDDFKNINDRFGHPSGDAVLKRIADIGRSVLRSEDSMARVGGEEFLLVLPRASETVSSRIAMRFLDELRQTRFTSVSGEPIKITASVGIANFGTGGLDAMSLYSNADAAQYQSKSSGKNRVTTYVPAVAT